jgi:hypothetical protein
MFRRAWATAEAIRHGVEARGQWATDKELHHEVQRGDEASEGGQRDAVRGRRCLNPGERSVGVPGHDENRTRRAAIPPPLAGGTGTKLDQGGFERHRELLGSTGHVRRRWRGKCFGSVGRGTPESVREMLVPTEPFRRGPSDGLQRGSGGAPGRGGRR